MKVISKAKQVLNSVPKRLAAIFGVVAAVMVPLAIYAWGPSRTTFTMEKPATYVTFNSITNNPNHGDERNFLSVRDTDKSEWDSANKNGWTDIINLQEGHTYEIQMYVHNNASANLGLVATNVRAHMNLPVMDSTYGKQFQVNAFLWSDNARPQEIWDNIVLKSDRAFHTKVVAAKYTTNKGVFDLNQDELFGSSGQGTGALLGYDKMDGNIPGCMQYAGYITIKFEPVFQVVPAPAYDVEKTVDKTTAKPGETINYTINVKNTGNVNLTNVKVTDKLPAYYSEAKETVTSKNGSTGSIVKGGEITLAKLNVGETATIKISYTIKGAEQLECGETIIKNKATGTTDQDQTEDNNNNNEVVTTVTNDCGYSYDLIKSVDKTTANLGDTLTYTLTFKNTGRQDVTNVVIKDALPAGVTMVGDIQTNPQTEVSGDLTKDGIKIAKVAAGKQVEITFTAKITATENELQCGDNKFTNTASSTTNEDQTEDNNDNNTVTTVVTRVCEPETPPVVPPETPEQPQSPVPETPTVIAQTGAGETVASIIGLGVLAAAITAYIRSRKLAAEQK